MARGNEAKHNSAVCTEEKRRKYLYGRGWECPEEGRNFTKPGYDRQFILEDAFKAETRGLMLCPVCGRHIANFKLRDRVRKIGQQEVWTVEEVREMPGDEITYWIELGGDFATRQRARESQLELANRA